MRLLLRVLAVVALALLAPATAGAAVTPITDGHLDWGLKASFRTYIGESGITLSQGATRNADGTFRFPVVSGSYDDATKTTDVTLAGQVRFYAHEGALDMTLTNPHVHIAQDGSTLFGDMDGKDLDGHPYSYPGVALGELGVAGKTPNVTDATTAWTGIPVTLTVDGTPAFAGFYAPGTVLDAASLTYAGPGGAPDAPAEETWTAPGTQRYAGLDRVSTAGEVRSSGDVVNGSYDASRGWVWLAAYDSGKVLAYDAQTLERKASVDLGPDFNPRNVVVDPRDGTVYAVDTKVKVIQPMADGFAVTQSLAIPGSATNDIGVSPTTGDVYVSQSQPGDQETLRVYDRDGDTYTAVDKVFDAYTFGPGPILFTPSGRTFVVQAAFGARQESGIQEISFAGGTITATNIPGTEGVTQAVVASDGTLTYQTQVVTYPPLVIKTQLTQARPTGDGWTVGILRDYGDGTLSLASSRSSARASGWPFFASGTSTSALAVVLDADHTDATSIALPGNAGAIIALPSGDAIVSAGTTLLHVGIASSPSITAQPQDVTVGLVTGATSATATFVAAANGTSPTFQWQTRAIGANNWVPVDGATAATLDVAARAVDNGTQYRAVVSNGAGQLATDPATLTVQTQAAIAVQPVDATVNQFHSVDLVVAPLGNPAPTVRWQVSSGGIWNDVAGGDDSTLHVTGLCDGAQYRAVLTNAVGQAVSRSVTVSVAYALKCGFVPANTATSAPQAVAPAATAPAPTAPATGSSNASQVTAPASDAPHLRSLSGTRKVDGRGRVAVASLSCAAASCRVTAPKRVTVTIDGRRFRVTVLAPRSLAHGKRATVRLRLPAAARKRLAGRSAKVAIRLTVGSGSTRRSSTVRVVLGR